MCYIIVLLVTISISGVFGFAQNSEDETLKQIKRDSRVFENIINEVLRENFDNPFAIAAEPRAAFLKGYGLTVTFQVKVNRGSIRGPWGEIDNPWTKQSTTKEDQISVIKKTMIQALADYGNTVKYLTRGDRITICAHIEDLNELDKTKARTVLLLSALRSNIQKYVTTQLTFEQFSQTLDILEY